MKTGHDTGVAIVSPEYWPLPWYFRDYKRVGYYQKVVPTTEPIIIGFSPGRKKRSKAMYGDQYQQIDSSKLNDPRILPDRNPNGSFSLRPGVDLLLYVRRDMAETGRHKLNCIPMMRLPKFVYRTPRTIAEAVKMFADAGPEAQFVAGGTDLYPNMKRRQQMPKTVISVMRLPELNQISGEGKSGISDWRVSDAHRHR